MIQKKLLQIEKLRIIDIYINPVDVHHIQYLYNNAVVISQRTEAKFIILRVSFSDVSYSMYASKLKPEKMQQLSAGQINQNIEKYKQ